MLKYSKNISKKNNKKVEIPETVDFTPDNAPADQSTPMNPLFIPDFFNNIRNNYFVGNRIIWLTMDIEWPVITEVMKRLAFYEDGTKEPIYIYIASNGGLCDAGWALIDMIEKVKKKGIVVNTICAGSCSSMAAVILASGTKGHRYAFPSSRIMIHQAGVGFTGGKLDEVEISVKELQYWTDLSAKYLSKVSKKKIKDVEKAMSYDHYMTADEAKKFGIIDKIDTVIA